MQPPMSAAGGSSLELLFLWKAASLGVSELLETLMRGFTTSYKSGVRREGLGDGQDFLGSVWVYSSFHW